MEISLLTLLIGLALGTFALGFIFARLAKLSRLSAPARQFATEGGSASTPATPEPADVLTATQMHYQQTHINSLNTNLRLMEEKLRWAEQDRQDAEDAMANLQRQLKAAKEPRGDEVTQREAELALLRAQLNAAINSASKLERKAIRAEHDAVAAKEENQQLRARLWAQQSTDMALSRLQDRQTALQAAVNENQITRDRLAGEVVTMNAALAEREALLADRDAMLAFADRKLKEKEDDYARLVTRENAWEKQAALLADTQAQAAQVERERDAAQRECMELRAALNDSGAQIQLVSERLHALHEAMALRDGQVTALHSELRRLQQENAEASDIVAGLREAMTRAEADVEAAVIAHHEDLALAKAAGESTANDLREALARTVAAAEETRAMLRLRDSAVTMLQEKLDLAGQQRETLEAALLLATANLQALREEADDAEAGRMLLEAELQNKTQALSVASDDLAQLSSREYELTVALERSSREHQSSFETVLLHLNKVEEDLARTQTEFAEQREEANRLVNQLRENELALQVTAQQMTDKDNALAALQEALKEKADALATGEVALLAAQTRADELAEEVNALALARNTLETHLQAKTAVLATAEAVIMSMRGQLAERDQQLADLRILANERGRELESAQAQIAYLTDGMDDLNNTANEKFEALQAVQAALNAAQTANEVAQARITQLTSERDALVDELAGVQLQAEALSSQNTAIHVDLTTALSGVAQLQSDLDELATARDALKDELAGAQKRFEALSGENNALRLELTAALTSAAQLQNDLDEAHAHIAQADEANADLSENVKVQAGELIALAKVKDQLESALKLAEARVEDLALALENAGAHQTAIDAKLQESELALDALRCEHAALLAEKAAGDESVKSLTEEILALANAKAALESNVQFMQSRVEGQIHELKVAAAKRADLEAKLQEGAAALNALEQTRRQHETAIAQAETRITELTAASEMAAGERLALETALHECKGRLEQMAESLNELRQAHTALLQEHDALRRAGDALEAQTRHQMETLIEVSNASAMLQQQLQERDAALLAAQVALAQAQHSLAAKPEPGTIEARLIDTALTLRRLEGEFAMLQAEKDAIEDEYTREGIAGDLRLQEKEVELRKCGARVDALELEIALLKAKND